MQGQVSKAMLRFTDSMCQVQWGSPSVTTWQRRCASSQARSDYQRSHPRNHRLEAFFRLLIILSLVLCVVAPLYLLTQILTP